MNPAKTSPMTAPTASARPVITLASARSPRPRARDTRASVPVEASMNIRFASQLTYAPNPTAAVAIFALVSRQVTGQIRVVEPTRNENSCSARNRERQQKDLPVDRHRWTRCGLEWLGRIGRTVQNRQTFFRFRHGRLGDGRGMGEAPAEPRIRKLRSETSTQRANQLLP